MPNPSNLPYISWDSLDSLHLSTSEVVFAIENLLRCLKSGTAWCPPKAVISPPDDRFIMTTLAAANDPPFMSVKALLLNPNNTQVGLDAIQSVVTLMDSRTGVPCAVLDGNWITAIRTAGLSAVAAKRLAMPDSKVIAFIGCGIQARSHLHAFAELFPLTEIRIFGRGKGNRDLLCQSAEKIGLIATDCLSAQEAIQGADIVVSSITLTPRPDPIIDASWLKPRAFAAIADLAIPWKPPGMANFDRIVIDDLQQEIQMESPMVPLSLVSGDLGQLVNQEVDGRTMESQRTAFVFRGLGIGDLAVAALAYKRFMDLK